MKRQNQKAVILTICAAIVLVAGCNEQNISKSEIRRSRLIVAENKQLGREIEKQKELLAKCLEEKKALEGQLQKSGESRMIDLLEAVTEENAKLHQIIDGLEAEIEQLDKELEELKKAAVGPQALKNHTEWVGECIKRIQAIKPEATRGELLEVFTTEGGMYTRLWRKYIYKECPYIKVDVKFKPVDSDKVEEKPGDVITEISKPYLEWSIMN